MGLALCAGTACEPASAAGSQGVANVTNMASAPKVIPDIQVQTLDGAPTRLQTELRGRPALVSFWASWCDACMDEIPALNKLSAAARTDAVVVGVAVGDTTEKARGVVLDKGLAYPNLVDAEFKLADAMGQRNVPFTMVLDREGRVVFTGGALDQAAVSAFDRARANVSAEPRP